MTREKGKGNKIGLRYQVCKYSYPIDENGNT